MLQFPAGSIARSSSPGPVIESALQPARIAALSDRMNRSVRMGLPPCLGRRRMLVSAAACKYNG